MKFKYCAFCYKSTPGGGWDQLAFGTANDRVNCIVFFKLFQRYLKIPEELNWPMTVTNGSGIGDPVQMEPCGICQIRIVKFKTLYHEMKCLELKLHLEIRRLMEVMKDGGKVGSRRRSLQLVFGDQRFEEFHRARKIWMNACCQELQYVYPKIKLTRLNVNVPVNPSGQEIEPEVMCKWLVSLTVIGFLLRDYSSIALENSDILGESYTFAKCEPDGIFKEESSDEANIKDEMSLPVDNPAFTAEGIEINIPGDLGDYSGSCHGSPHNDDDGMTFDQLPYDFNCNQDSKGVLVTKSPSPVKLSTTPNQAETSEKPYSLRKRSAPAIVKSELSESGADSSGHDCKSESPATSETSSDDLDQNSDNSNPDDSNQDEKYDIVTDPSAPVKVEVSNPPNQLEITEEPFSLRIRSASAIVESDCTDSAPENSGYGDFKCESSASSETSRVGKNSDNLKEIDTEPKNKPNSRHPKRNLSSSRKPRRSASSKYFSCYLDGCNFRTRRREAKVAHKSLHELGSFSCQFCDRKEATPMLLCMHEYDQHAEKSEAVSGPTKPRQFSCRRCSFKTCYKQIYANHFATEHLNISGLAPITAHICSICKVEVKFPKRHFRLVHDTSGVHASKIIPCPEANCDAVFISELGLDRHRREFHEITGIVSVFPCEHCETTYFSKNLLKRHMDQMHNRFPCPLDKCKRTFARRKDANLHSKLHGSYACTACDFRTGYSPDFVKHGVDCLQLKTSEGWYFCPECEYNTKRFSAFIDHRLETHFGASLKIYKCHLCSLSFTGNARRDDHVKTYHEKKPSVKQGKAKHHSEVELNEFSCPEKDAPIYFQYIRKHKRYLDMLSINPDAKSLKMKNFCDMCREQFPSDQGFENHSKFHATWKCPFCPVEKAYAPDLALHEVYKHGTRVEEENAPGIKKYTCSRCSWSFKGKNIFNETFVKHFLVEHLAACIEECF